ncbi:MAG TPA: trypsin-like serine protease [Enhygromyxa sp.]|nr:trypsin-like serine protease [Enhygromyxa sp.]
MMFTRFSGALLILASLSLPIAACDADDPASEQLDDDDDSFRVEIGSNDVSSPVRNAVARVGGCTGTLVAPDLMLTAAHCGFINEAYFTGGWTTLPSPVTVQFGPDRDSPLLTRTATQVSAPPLHTSGPDWVDDIVLLRLSSSVPANIAVPRPVYLDHPAPLKPNSSLPQTIFQIGYGGGRDRRIMTGSDYDDWLSTPTRQHNSFVYEADEAGPGIGDRDTNIEGGDSGGPMLLNSDIGPVVGVLSHWAPTGIAAYGPGTGGRSPIRSWLMGKLPTQKSNFEIVQITEGGCSGVGGNPMISVTIKNSGAVTARAWVDVFTGLGSPPSIGDFSTIYRQSNYIAPEGTQTLAFEITSGFDTGWVDVLVDTTQTVAELDETDNASYDYLNLPDCSFN